MEQTRVWALTGGIASGKSTACALIREAIPATVFFDSDECVSRLLDGSGPVEDAIAARFGEEIRRDGGGVERKLLRERVFENPEERKALGQILHPKVREECLESLARARKLGAPLFLADVPLLFENGFDLGQECNLLVAVG